MIVAVTYENGKVFQHFGHTKQLKIYDIEDNNIKQERIIGVNENGHGALSQKDFEAPKIDYDKCIKCGKCSNFCPKKALVLDLKKCNV